MSVWIAQCLCPARHCIIAALKEADDLAHAEAVLLPPLRERLDTMLHSGEINPWCGLCLAPSTSWNYEVERTRYDSMSEAEAPLRQCEAEQAAVREAFATPSPDSR
jgi:hypothetical protein